MQRNSVHKTAVIIWFKKTDCYGKTLQKAQRASEVHHAQQMKYG